MDQQSAHRLPMRFPEHGRRAGYNDEGPVARRDVIFSQQQPHSTFWERQRRLAFDCPYVLPGLTAKGSEMGKPEISIDRIHGNLICAAWATSVLLPARAWAFHTLTIFEPYCLSYGP